MGRCRGIRTWVRRTPAPPPPPDPQPAVLSRWPHKHRQLWQRICGHFRSCHAASQTVIKVTPARGARSGAPLALCPSPAPLRRTPCTSTTLSDGCCAKSPRRTPRPRSPAITYHCLRHLGADPSALSGPLLLAQYQP